MSAFEWLVSAHRQKVSKLNKELDKVQRHRTLQRAGRKRSGAPVAALVGYTNAGKSALLNAITGASIVSQDRLFCTLDPTMRSTRLPVRTTPQSRPLPSVFRCKAQAEILAVGVVADRRLWTRAQTPELSRAQDSSADGR